MKRFPFTLIASVLILLCASSARAQSKDTTKITATDPTEDNVTYTNVGKNGIEAEYPGGPDAWGNFLKHNLHYPDDAINNEISGTVYVMFLVGKDSTVSYIQAIAGPEKGGLREEAIRVITASGKWAPALINGHPVKSYKKVPIKFVMMKS
jgi:outer membrane biosynthesis protein TonB